VKEGILCELHGGNGKELSFEYFLEAFRSHQRQFRTTFTVQYSTIVAEIGQSVLKSDYPADFS
jgi:hypothetical protein